MEKCIVCGNDYDKAVAIEYKDHSFMFDCFECAVHKLAPKCDKCGQTVMEYGIESIGHIYCGACCAKKDSITAKITVTEKLKKHVNNHARY